MQFYQHQLSNGLNIVAELTPSVHSVAAGFFVRTGARDETDSVSGVSHFLEHMAFKGNDQYSADDVNRIFDEVGARYNASTAEDVTTYYAAVLPEYLTTTMEMLSILMQPSLRQEDFDIEKHVILEEIGMYDDMPSFTAYDNVMATHFSGHPLGQSILGTNESITDLTADQMRTYHKRQYHAANITLTVAGNTDFASVLSLAEQYCGDIPSGICARELPPVEPQQRSEFIVKAGSGHQNVMQMGLAPLASDPLRFAAELLAVIVGDDSGSRMFWDIVYPGHADSAELGYNEYDGAGTWMTYLSCNPEHTSENLQRMQAIFDVVNSDGVTEEELEQARNKVASRIVLRGERPMGRLSSLGGNWLYRGEYSSVTNDLEIVRNIGARQIWSLLQKYPLNVNTTIGVGPLETL
ncbi:MAG: insulinase family protein [Fuerstiella sp.]|nr:insulinase family protein [Fuerstiella sp.]